MTLPASIIEATGHRPGQPFRVEPWGTGVRLVPLQPDQDEGVTEQAADPGPG